MLNIKNLFLRYTKEFYALCDISLSVEEGESVAFVGEDCSGKTSLLRAIAKLEKIEKGEIYINKKPLNRIDFKDDINVGYVPYSPVFLNKKSVIDNFAYILKTNGMKKIDIPKKINEALVEFSIEKIKDEKIENLEIEDKYILSLIRLSFRDLDLLMVDNIFDEISEEYIDAIINMILSLKKEKTTLIVATTKEEIADKLCQRKIHFSNGSIVD